MSDIFGLIQDLVPFITQISLQDFGILLGLDMTILNLLNSYSYFYWLMIIPFLIWVVGFFRNRTTIEFSINDISADGSSKIRFEQIKILKIPSNQSQFTMDVFIKSDFSGKDLILNWVKDQVCFYVICQYHPTQLNLSVSSGDFTTILKNGNVHEVVITDHMSKKEILCPTLVMTRGLEDKKDLKLSIKLIPISETRLNRFLTWLLNSTLFSAVNRIQINN
jgi:hypothetical protein